MMELYIRVDANGQPVEHPILGDNFREAFPHIDTNNLPPEFARFNRLPPPDAPPVETFKTVAVEYVLKGDTFEYVYSVRDMTPDEKAEATQKRIDSIILTVADLTQVAETQKADAAHADKAVWQAYLDKLATVTTDDPFKVSVPMPPRKGENGDWLTTENEGSAPDVIG